MKPIEPGCLALILRGNMRNHVCTVVEKIPANQPFTIHPDRTWESERLSRFPCDAWRVDLASDPSVGYTVAEHNLMRIDGDEEEGVTTEQDQEVTA